MRAAGSWSAASKLNGAIRGLRLHLQMITRRDAVRLLGSASAWGVAGRGAVRLEQFSCAKCLRGQEAVPVSSSRNRIAARRKAEGHPPYTEYSGVDHDGTTGLAFTEPALVKWLFSQRLGKHADQG